MALIASGNGAEEYVATRLEAEHHSRVVAWSDLDRSAYRLTGADAFRSLPEPVQFLLGRDAIREPDNERLMGGAAGVRDQVLLFAGAKLAVHIDRMLPEIGRASCRERV